MGKASVGSDHCVRHAMIRELRCQVGFGAFEPANVSDSEAPGRKVLCSCWAVTDTPGDNRAECRGALKHFNDDGGNTNEDYAGTPAVGSLMATYTGVCGVRQHHTFLQCVYVGRGLLCARTRAGVFHL